jgi:hypothetical protein
VTYSTPTTDATNEPHDGLSSKAPNPTGMSAPHSQLTTKRTPSNSSNNTHNHTITLIIIFSGLHRPSDPTSHPHNFQLLDSSSEPSLLLSRHSISRTSPDLPDHRSIWKTVTRSPLHLKTSSSDHRCIWETGHQINAASERRFLTSPTYLEHPPPHNNYINFSQQAKMNAITPAQHQPP